MIYNEFWKFSFFFVCQIFILAIFCDSQILRFCVCVWIIPLNEIIKTFCPNKMVSFLLIGLFSFSGIFVGSVDISWQTKKKLFSEKNINFVRRHFNSFLFNFFVIKSNLLSTFSFLHHFSHPLTHSFIIIVKINYNSTKREKRKNFKLTTTTTTTTSTLYSVYIYSQHVFRQIFIIRMMMMMIITRSCYYSCVILLLIWLELLTQVIQQHRKHFFIIYEILDESNQMDGWMKTANIFNLIDWFVMKERRSISCFKL